LARPSFSLALVAVGAFGLHGVRAAAATYDPLRVEGPAPGSIELTIDDPARQRAIPIRVYLPHDPAPAPVVLFSHGLGGSRNNNPYLGEHWAKRGYVAVFLQHAGSDESVWRDTQPRERAGALRGAASPKSFVERAADVRVAIDALARFNVQRSHPLAGRLDLAHLGMSGHSFGALTTEAVSGLKFAGRDFTDSRIRAAVAMSPSPPRRMAADPVALARAFGGVRIPWLLLTGTEDGSPIGGIEPADRLEVFPALPPGGKYELVLHGAHHSAFGDRPLPGDHGARNPNHHRAILALTTAFWDAYLRDDSQARAWLDGHGPRSVLEARDRWQRK
jgi:predicted dienelactone hydrolase